MADETGSEETQSTVEQTPVVEAHSVDDSMQPIVMAAMPTAEKKSKGIKPGWLIGGFVALLALFGVAWGALGELPGVGEFPLSDQLEAWMLDAPWAKEQDIFAMIPADVGVVGFVSTEFDGAAWNKMEALWDRFPKSETWFNEAEESMTSGDSDGADFDWNEQFKPWIGSEVAMFATMDAFVPESTADPMVAIVTTTSNKNDAIDAFIQINDDDSIETIEDAEMIDYRSEELIKLDSSTFGLVMDHYAFVFSSEKMAEKVIDLYKDGGDTIASNADFIAYRESVKDTVGGFLIPSMKGYVESIFASQQALTGTNTDEMESVLGIYDAYGLMGMHLQPEADGLVIGEAIAMDFEALVDQGLAGSLNAFEPVLAAHLPADTAFFVEMNSAGTDEADFAKQLESLPGSYQEMLSGYSEILANLETVTDVSLQTDIFPLLAGDGGMGLWSTADGAPTMALLTETDDATFAIGVMDKVAKAVLTYGMVDILNIEGMTPDDVFAKYIKTTDLDGVTVKSFVPTTEEPPLPDFMNISYAVVEGYLILATDESGIQAFMDAGATGGSVLAEASEAYQTVRAKQPDKVTGSTLYVGRESMVKWIGNLVNAMGVMGAVDFTQAQMMTTEMAQWNRDLAPLEAFSVWASKEDNVMLVNMFLSIPE